MIRDLSSDDEAVRFFIHGKISDSGLFLRKSIRNFFLVFRHSDLVVEIRGIRGVPVKIDIRDFSAGIDDMDIAVRMHLNAFAAETKSVGGFI